MPSFSITQDKSYIEQKESSEDLYLSPSFFVFKYDRNFNIIYSNPNCQIFLGLNPNTKISSKELTMLNGSRDHFAFFEKLNPVTYTESTVKVNGNSIFLKWANFTSASEDGQIQEVTCMGVDLQNWSLLKQRLDKAEKKSNILFNSVDVPIIITDINGKIIEANEELCNLLGYSREELMLMEARDLMTEEYSELLKKMGEIISKSAYFEFIFEIMKKSGKTFFVHCKSRMVDIDGKNVILTVGKDLTEKRKIEEEEKRRRFRYDIHNCNIYLSEDTNRETAIDAFNNLLSCGYYGIVISSRPKDDFDNLISGHYKFFKISNHEDCESLPPNYQFIDRAIGEIPRKSVVLIEDIEYLEANTGYTNTILFMKSLKELAMIKYSVFILCVDMNLIQQKAAYILEKETHKIIKKSGDVISFNMERILSYIHEKNLNGIQPTHTEIGKVLRLTRPTVKRNVSRLISNKYIVAHADGRAKRLEITHKGKVELENRVY